jgi:hypothetical protein
MFRSELPTSIQSARRQIYAERKAVLKECGVVSRPCTKVTHRHYLIRVDMVISDDAGHEMGLAHVSRQDIDGVLAAHDRGGR